jgi:hypothetical protein
MKVLELVQAAQSSRSKAFGTINDERSVAIVRAVIAELNKAIKNTEEGEIALPGLGVFVAKKVKSKKDGVEETKRKVMFRIQHIKKAKKAD